ncbi:MAG: ATP-binding protein [Gaiellaceae bacterium]
MSELPGGTVTFLFTDIEGSTRLLHELGDAYAEALAEHRRVLREAFAAHEGVEVDTQGDAFFVAFARARDALAAAGEGQQALTQGALRVRMGVHTGEPLVTDEGYVGIDVHRAARIAAVGNGGQVLVSAVTVALLDPSNTVLLDLGEHRLKDLTAPERIYQLGEGEFPPLKSLNTTNLPIAASPLVGREREVGELAGLLSNSARLVTLTGPGGTGKTRLALQAAGELVEAFPGGVFFVPLAGVPSAELVAGTIASTVGVRELGELRDRRALLLLDNFEHLLDAAPAVAEVLRAGESAKVLTTSRAPLRIEGEREYPVEPLPEAEAFELLTERALAVRPDFVPDEAAREVCRRLEGLPLAIELAASRLRSLGSVVLLERLERRLPVLTSGRRDVPERQRTLRATVEWSYDLLEPGLQRLFARLSVFATFSLQAAETVAEADLDAVDALVEASLLKHTGGDRYLMLETIRELALERLEAAGEAGEIRRRHAEYFLELAKSANLNIEANGPQRHDLVNPERDNIRAALEGTLEVEEAELGLRLVFALENFWNTSDPLEGRRWLEALLARAPTLDPWLHAFALRLLGNAAAITGDQERSVALYGRSYEEFRDCGDELRAAIMRHRLAINLGSAGQMQRARPARSLMEESLAYFSRVGFAKGEAQCHTFFGNVAWEEGDVEPALEHFDRAIQLSNETGFTWWEIHTLLVRAEKLFELGRTDEAGRSAREALELGHRIRDRLATVEGLGLLARAAIERGDEQLAGRLWGALEAEAERAPVAAWEELREELGTPIFARAGSAFEAARAGGRALSLDAAVQLALGGND